MSVTARRSPVDDCGPRRILVLDAAAETQQVLLNGLGKNEYEVTLRNSTDDLEEILGTEPHFHALLVEVRGGASRWLERLPALRDRCPWTAIILVASPDAMHLWSQAIQRGAYDYVPKEIRGEDLRWVVANAAGSTQPGLFRNGRPPAQP